MGLPFLMSASFTRRGTSCRYIPLGSQGALAACSPAKMAVMSLRLSRAKYRCPGECPRWPAACCAGNRRRAWKSASPPVVVDVDPVHLPLRGLVVLYGGEIFKVVASRGEAARHSFMASISGRAEAVEGVLEIKHTGHIADGSPVDVDL